MDPDVNLAHTLLAADHVLRANGESSEATELAEHVLSMHEWLSCGGFLPKKWNVVERERPNVASIVERVFSDVNEAAMLGVFADTEPWKDFTSVAELRAHLAELLLDGIVKTGLLIEIDPEVAGKATQAVWDSMKTDYGDEWHVNHQDIVAVRLVEVLGVS